MKMKSLNWIAENNPGLYKSKKKLLEKLIRVKEIVEFPVNDNVKKWLSEEQLNSSYIIDIREVRDALNKGQRVPEYGTWIALPKEIFNS